MTGDKVEFNTPDEQPKAAPKKDAAQAKADTKWQPFKWDNKATK